MVPMYEYALMKVIIRTSNNYDKERFIGIIWFLARIGRFGERHAYTIRK
jgi:hypothetical protein